MPNHVATRIVTNPRVIDEITTEVDGERHFDFNVLIPMPSDDDPIFTATKTDWGAMGVGWSFDGYSPMEWARGHWGTKWNSYDNEFTPVSGDLVEMKFETAWSHPLPVIKRLIEKYPHEVFYVQYADEDLGSNMSAYVVHMANDMLVNLTTDDDGSLPSHVLDQLSANHDIDVQRCIEMAAPQPYDRNRTDEQNDAAADWARWVHYRETPEMAKLSNDAWELAYAEFTKLNEEEQKKLRATGWIGERESEIKKELATQRGITIEDNT